MTTTSYHVGGTAAWQRYRGTNDRIVGDLANIWKRSSTNVLVQVSRKGLTCSDTLGAAQRGRERAGRARAKLARTGCVERAFSDVEGLTGVTHVAYTGPGHVLAAREAPPIACQSGRIRGRPRACALGRTSVRSTTPSLAFSQLSSLRCTPAPCHPSPPHRRLPLGPANPAEPTSQRSHHYPRWFCAQSHPTLDT